MTGIAPINASATEPALAWLDDPDPVQLAAATPQNPLLAQARPTSAPARSWADIVGGAILGGAPDAIVYSNAALLAPANAKSFVLANPFNNSYTHFISHPRDTVAHSGPRRWPSA